LRRIVLALLVLAALRCASTNTPAPAPRAEASKPDAAAGTPKAASAPAPAKPAPPSKIEHGLTCEDPIVIEAANEGQGVPLEYAWIKQHYPGYRQGGQGMSLCRENSIIDSIEFTTAAGEKKTVYFDITKWFGKL
jgi:hypothetical protein